MLPQPKMTEQSAKNDFINIESYVEQPPPLFEMDSVESAGPASFGHSQKPPLHSAGDFDDFGTEYQTKSFGVHQNDNDDNDPFGFINNHGSSGDTTNKALTTDLLGDFIEKERGDPPAPPKFDVQAEINTVNGNNHDNHDDSNEANQIPDDLYLNPYTSSKLESNEKFISTDDLMELSDNESKPEKEKEIAFEDCNKEDEIETVQEIEPIAPEPVKPIEAPVKVEEPKVPKPEPPKPKSTKNVELLEAEKLFIRFGLGKLQFHNTVAFKFMNKKYNSHLCVTGSCAVSIFWVTHLLCVGNWITYNFP